jgi:hypothetical protein
MAREHAQSCVYWAGGDCDCGYDPWPERPEEELELATDHRFPPHTCVIGPEGPCQACWMLEEERAASEPSDEYLYSRAIHDDHAQGNEEPEELEEPF